MGTGTGILNLRNGSPVEAHGRVNFKLKIES